MRVPAAAISAGTRELAMRSQSRRVSAGRPGVAISMVAEFGLRMLGMSPEMASVGGIGRTGGRPAAVNVLKTVEVVGGGAEAL